MSDFVSKSGKTYACSLSTQCPATETFVLYIHFKDQNTQGKGKPRLTTNRHPKSAYYTHIHT